MRPWCPNIIGMAGFQRISLKVEKGVPFGLRAIAADGFRIDGTCKFNEQAMKILHLLSQTQLTGAEVYALALCRYQLAHGHSCLIVSDRLHRAAPAPHIALPIHDRHWWRRWQNINRVTVLVRSEGVDLIHAHSRAASWIANRVRRRVRVGYVSTVHGRQSVHFTSRHFNAYGHHVLAVCTDLAEQLVTELGMPAEYVRVVPNGLD